MKGLSARIIPAIIYASSIIGACSISSLLTAILMVIFCGFCIYEFVSITLGELDKKVQNILILTLIFLTLVISVGYYYIPNISLVFSIISGYFILYNSFFVVVRKQVSLYSNQYVINLLGYLIIPFSLLIFHIFQLDTFKLLILYSFILIWANDTGAYIFGSYLGNNKLLPTISPGKTWEGTIGGFVITILIALALRHWTYPMWTDIVWIILTVSATVIGTLGDLVESCLKRHFNLKDSSNLIPGHGGFLDRLDSFIFVAVIINFIYYLDLI